MNRPVIAVDLDDVLADEKEALRLFVNEAYSANLSRQDFDIEAPYWEYWETAQGISQAEGKVRYQAFLDSGGKAKIKVIKGVTKAIEKLKQDYSLIIVTARKNDLFELTHKWLELHFPKTFSGVEFVELWTGDRKANKASICKEIDATYLIDDNADHCTQAAEVGITALLFGDYGWNRSFKLSKGMVRVKNWLEIEKFFDGKNK